VTVRACEVPDEWLLYAVFAQQLLRQRRQVNGAINTGCESEAVEWFRAHLPPAEWKLIYDSFPTVPMTLLRTRCRLLSRQGLLKNSREFMQGKSRTRAALMAPTPVDVGAYEITAEGIEFIDWRSQILPGDRTQRASVQDTLDRIGAQGDLVILRD
jgi:hypothetical protein